MFRDEAEIEVIAGRGGDGTSGKLSSSPFASPGGGDGPPLPASPVTELEGGGFADGWLAVTPTRLTVGSMSACSGCCCCGGWSLGTPPTGGSWPEGASAFAGLELSDHVVAGAAAETTVVALDLDAGQGGQVLGHLAAPLGEVGEDQDLLVRGEHRVHDLLESGQLAGATGERAVVVLEMPQRQRAIAAQVHAPDLDVGLTRAQIVLT